MSDATKDKDKEKEGKAAPAKQEEVQEDSEFRQQQKARAADQNQFAENAVPEQRPQASQMNEDPDSPLTARLKEAKHPSISIDEPMPESAFTAAQEAAEADTEEGAKEGVHAGSRIRVTGGPFEGEIGAVTRIVEHGSVADLVRNMAGRPEQLYNQPKVIEVTLVGGDRDSERILLDNENDEWEKLNEGWVGSREGRRH